MEPSWLMFLERDKKEVRLLYIFAGAGSWKQLHETKTQSSSLWDNNKKCSESSIWLLNNRQYVIFFLLWSAALNVNKRVWASACADLVSSSPRIRVHFVTTHTYLYKLISVYARAAVLVSSHIYASREKPSWLTVRLLGSEIIIYALHQGIPSSWSRHCCPLTSHCAQGRYISISAHIGFSWDAGAHLCGYKVLKLLDFHSSFYVVLYSKFLIPLQNCSQHMQSLCTCILNPCFMRHWNKWVKDAMMECSVQLNCLLLESAQIGELHVPSICWNPDTNVANCKHDIEFLSTSCCILHPRDFEPIIKQLNFSRIIF